MLYVDKPKKQIIVDLDGTLLDNKFRHYACYADILNSLGMNVLTIEEFWNLKRQAQPVYSVLEKTNAQSKVKKFTDEWLDGIENNKYLEKDLVHDGVFDVLNFLKEKNFYLALVTMRNDRQRLIEQLKYLGLYDFFDVVVSIGREQKLSKSDAVKKYLNSNNVFELWVGDTEQDIESARLLGIKMCAVTNGIRDREFIGNYKPDYVLESITGLDEVIRKLS